MGQLVAWHYPTQLALELADHTYVACGNGGKAWSCWGGKTGGNSLVQGTCSTRRADAIAEADERAGITCYLVNGVCHQAANRILMPAGVTVQNARGYGLSMSIFGVYGRPRGVMVFCRAPFNQHPGVTGDLSECTGAGPLSAGTGSTGPAGESAEEEQALKRFLSRAAESYSQMRIQDIDQFAPEQTSNFMLGQYELYVEYRLGSEFINTRLWRGMADIRMAVEQKQTALEERLVNGELTVDEFVDQGHIRDIEFQNNLANALDVQSYSRLFYTGPDEQFVLGDPEIAGQVYGSGFGPPEPLTR